MRANWGLMPAHDDPVNQRPRADVLDTWETADGARIIIRPLHADDVARELRFLEGLSQQTLYERTFARRDRLKPGELGRLVRFDVRNQIALVAALLGAEEEFLGVVRLARSPEGEFEFAIVVHDAWQGRGVATRLMETLLAAARHAGIKHIGGVTLASNVALQALARKTGFDIRRDPEDATVLLLDITL